MKYIGPFSYFEDECTVVASVTPNRWAEFTWASGKSIQETACAEAEY